MRFPFFPLLLTLPAVAAPTLNDSGPVPRGGMVGTTVKLQINGERLGEARELLSPTPGLAFGEIKSAADGKSAELEVKIAPDCPLGEHTVRLRGTTGWSYLRTFWVGPFPFAAEKEPNNKPSEAQELTGPVTVEGVLNSEDPDHFFVNLEKGARLSVEVAANRLGRGIGNNQPLDPHLSILDEKGFTLASCDDAALLGQDAFLCFTAPEKGRYTILLREASYSGDGSCRYHLHVGSFPRPIAVWPPGGKPGETRKFRFLFADGTSAEQELKVPAADPASDRSPLCFRDPSGPAPSPNWIRSSDLPAFTENVDSNWVDNAVVANAPVDPGLAFEGVIEKKDDQDYFGFEGKKDQKVTVAVYARRLGSPFDPDVHLLDDKGKYLQGGDDQDGSLDGRFTHTLPADGRYFIRVKDFLNTGNPADIYRVEVTANRPKLLATLPSGQNNETQPNQTIQVPRGGKFGAIFKIARDNCGGPVSLAFDNLPAGLKLLTNTAPDGAGELVALFEASADAPVAGGLLQPRFELGNSPVRGNFFSRIELVRGDNNRTFHQVATDRLAVAVTEPAPFTVELRPPPTPLSRDGNLTLRIVVKRAEGFKGAVEVRLPLLPGGVSGPGSVTLEENTAEADFKLDATDKASEGEMPVFVVGRAERSGGGSVENATGFTPLKIVSQALRLDVEMASLTQGGEARFPGKLEVLRPFPGEATLTLENLPGGVTADPVKVNAQTKEVSFLLRAKPDAPIAKHQGILVRADIPENGKTATLYLARNTVLRLDAPPKNAPPPPPADVAKKPDQPAEKPLSRLEQLRKQSQAK